MKLLSAEQIADMLHLKPRTVKEKWTCRPDFPRPYLEQTALSQFQAIVPEHLETSLREALLYGVHFSKVEWTGHDLKYQSFSPSEFLMTASQFPDQTEEQRQP